jgi:hypothetical protein
VKNIFKNKKTDVGIIELWFSILFEKFPKNGLSNHTQFLRENCQLFAVLP